MNSSQPFILLAESYPCTRSALKKVPSLICLPLPLRSHTQNLFPSAWLPTAFRNHFYCSDHSVQPCPPHHLHHGRQLLDAALLGLVVPCSPKLCVSLSEPFLGHCHFSAGGLDLSLLNLSAGAEQAEANSREGRPHWVHTCHPVDTPRSLKTTPTILAA